MTSIAIWADARPRLFSFYASTPLAVLQYFLESTKVLLRKYCSTGLKVLTACFSLSDKELEADSKTQERLPQMELRQPSGIFF